MPEDNRTPAEIADAVMERVGRDCATIDPLNETQIYYIRAMIIAELEGK